MSLEDWLRAAKIIKHKTSKEEIEAVFGVVERNLKDAALKGLSSDQKYIQSYQAAFEASLALLYHNGYKPVKSGGHHTVVWQCMREILEPEQQSTILLFENAAKKRSKMSYDMAGIASQKEADEMYEEARSFTVLIRSMIGTMN